MSRLLALLTILLVATSVRAAGKAKSPAEARSLYLQKCAGCHGKSGKAVPLYARLNVRDLDDPEWQKTKADDQLRESIARGKTGTAMRSFDKELKPEEIDALVRHVRTLARQAPASR